jgi:glucose uptake protein
MYSLSHIPHPLRKKLVYVGLLFAGLALAVFAVLLTAIAGKMNEVNRNDDDNDKEDCRLVDGLLVEEEEETSSSPDKNFTKGVLTSLLSGVLMSCWSPLNAIALADLDKTCDENRGKLTAYSSFLIFTASIVLSSALILCPLVLKYPVDGKKSTSLSKCLSVRPLSYHLVGLLGGAIWSIGTLSNSISGMKLGLALSYAIGQAAPMVATTWGLLYYNEYANAPHSSYISLALMYVFYMGAICLVALSK